MGAERRGTQMALLNMFSPATALHLLPIVFRIKFRLLMMTYFGSWLCVHLFLLTLFLPTLPNSLCIPATPLLCRGDHTVALNCRSHISFGFIRSRFLGFVHGYFLLSINFRGKNCFLRVLTFLPKPHLPTEPLSIHPPFSHSTFHNLNSFDLPIYSIKACPLLQVYILCNNRAQYFPLLLCQCLGHSLTNTCEMG